MAEKEFTCISGEKIKIDTSKEACNRFGFDPNDRVETKLLQKKATVIGVAHSRDSEKDELWFSFDEDEGKISMLCQHETVTKI